MPSQFKGFSIDAIKFLDSLRKNNNRQWFEKNKHNYESLVREPALQFIEAMVEPMQKISPHFLVQAKKTGGSLMRVYRDIRFSKDKTPYKTNIGIQFGHEKGKDVHAPGYYLHIEPNEVFIGAGIWRPDPKTLVNIRKKIANKPNEWTKIVSDKYMSKSFSQAGDRLKRPPRGYDADHPLIDDIKRKDHILVANLDLDFVTKRTLCSNLGKLFQECSPYMNFLCGSLKLKY